MDNLDDVLNGSDAVEVAAPETPVTEPIADAPAQPRDEHGRFAPKGDTLPEPAAEPAPTAPPAVEDDPTGLIPRKALIEERRKRQELEQRLEAALRQPPQVAPQAAPEPQAYAEPQYLPDPYQDPHGYAEYLVRQAVAVAEQRLAPQVHSTRMDLVREMVRSQNADYDDVESVYRDLIKDTPALHAEVMRQPNPVQYAYDLTKKYMRFQELGATDLQSLEQQIRAKVEAELKAQTPAPPPPIPSSLADAQSARTSAASMAPPSLNDILGRR